MGKKSNYIEPEENNNMESSSQCKATTRDIERQANEDEVKRNMFVAARGHIQRVIDVSLLVSNMSRLAIISVRWDHYKFYQASLLVAMLIVSIVAQVVAAVCFFATQQRNIYNRCPQSRLDYAAFICVGIVMISNIFISTCDAAWGVGT